MKLNFTSGFMLLSTLLIFLFTGSSCKKRKLEAPSGLGKTTINLDWKNLLTGEFTPPGVKLYFYKSDGTIVTKDSNLPTFIGSLVVGSYKVLAYNTDAQGVAYRNLDTYAGAQIYTSAFTKASYISQPVHAYGTGVADFTVLSDETVSLTITPVSYVKEALISISITGNRSAIASVTASLSGIVQAVSLTTGLAQGEPGTITMEPVATVTGYESNITFLGIANPATNNLEVVFNFKAGGSQKTSVDLTSQLAGVIPDELVINVNVEITGSIQSGYVATLRDWNITNRSITVK